MSVGSSSPDRCETNSSLLSTPKTPGVSRNPPQISSTSPQISSCTTPPTKVVPSTSQVKCPEYTIYKDKEIEAAVLGGNIPVELRHRLIRGTIHNMISVAYNAPFNRMPTMNELQEMAKSLIIVYPPLQDPVTGHVSLYICKIVILYRFKNYSVYAVGYGNRLMSCSFLTQY